MVLLLQQNYLVHDNRKVKIWYRDRSTVKKYKRLTELRRQIFFFNIYVLYKIACFVMFVLYTQTVHLQSTTKIQ